MNYGQAHEAFMSRHLAARSGERLGRLKRGHGHAEKLFLHNVWWPLRVGLRGLTEQRLRVNRGECD